MEKRKNWQFKLGELFDIPVNEFGFPGMKDRPTVFNGFATTVEHLEEMMEQDWYEQYLFHFTESQEEIDRLTQIATSYKTPLVEVAFREEHVSTLGALFDLVKSIKYDGGVTLVNLDFDWSSLLNFHNRQGLISSWNQRRIFIVEQGKTEYIQLAEKKYSRIMRHGFHIKDEMKQTISELHGFIDAFIEEKKDMPYSSMQIKMAKSYIQAILEIYYGIKTHYDRPITILKLINSLSIKNSFLLLKGCFNGWTEIKTTSVYVLDDKITSKLKEFLLALDGVTQVDSYENWTGCTEEEFKELLALVLVAYDLYSDNIEKKFKKVTA